MSATVHKIDPADHAKKEGMYLRRIIRRNKGDILTNSEIKVLVALLNLWLHHRYGQKKYIHPGRKLLSKKAKVDSKTVSRSLEVFRMLGLATAIKHLKGGSGRATQYTINTLEIQALFDPTNVVTVAGELVPFSGTFATQNVPLKERQNVPLSIGIVSHRPSPESASFEGGDNE